jgi:hypothetical protein
MARRVANDVQTGVRLPAQLYEDLQEAAGGGPVSEEIRKRLADSFATAGPVSDDPRFRDIMTAIGQAAPIAVSFYKDDPWPSFAMAVPYLLAVFQPEDMHEGDPYLDGGLIASSALTAMGRTDLLARLKDVVGRAVDRGDTKP